MMWRDAIIEDGILQLAPSFLYMTKFCFGPFFLRLNSNRSLHCSRHHVGYVS
jgi:hypothetical protein